MMQRLRRFLEAFACAWREADTVAAAPVPLKKPDRVQLLMARLIDPMRYQVQALFFERAVLRTPCVVDCPLEDALQHWGGDATSLVEVLKTSLAPHGIQPSIQQDQSGRRKFLALTIPATEGQP